MNKSKNGVAKSHSVSDCLKKSALNLNGCTEKSLRVLQSKTQLPLAREPLKSSLLEANDFVDDTLKRGFSPVFYMNFLMISATADSLFVLSDI